MSSLDSARSTTTALELRVDSFRGSPAHGRVSLVNRGPVPIRVWEPGSSVGDSILSFRLGRGERTVNVARRLGWYTRNLPKATTLQPGQGYHWDFDLGDGFWQAEGGFEGWFENGTELTALIHIVDDADARKQDVWVGALESARASWHPD